MERSCNLNWVHTGEAPCQMDVRMKTILYYVYIYMLNITTTANELKKKFKKNENKINNTLGLL